MKPLLIILCTALCGIGGRQLRCLQRFEQDRTLLGAVAETHLLGEERQSNREPRSEAIRARIDQFVAQVGSEYNEELALRIASEFQDLQEEEFKDVIIAFFQHAPTGTEAAELLAGMWAERDLPAARTLSLIHI